MNQPLLFCFVPGFDHFKKKRVLPSNSLVFEWKLHKTLENIVIVKKVLPIAANPSLRMGLLLYSYFWVCFVGKKKTIGFGASREIMTHPIEVCIY